MSTCPPITRADLEARFGPDEVSQLLDDLPAPDDTLAQVARDSWAVVEGYVGGLYRLPIVPPLPPLLLGALADITRYRLWDKRAPSEVRKRYEDALAMLRDVAKGTIKLAIAPNVQPETGYGGTIATTSRQRAFTDDTLAGFVSGTSPSWPPRTG